MNPIKEFITMAFEQFKNFGNFSSEGKVEALDNLGLIAGSFDAFGLEKVINNAVGKEGSHVIADTGVVVKALVMQLLNVPYQTLDGTKEYYSNRPLNALCQQKITANDLNRNMIARVLDRIYDYGSKDLYLLCTSQVFNSLGIKVQCAHIDSTSIHYHGEGYKQEGCHLELKLGYSRDSHPELKQVISLMLADDETRIPMFEKNLSGNVNDNVSFYDVVNEIPEIQKQFTDLKYLVGDSALCTDKIFKEAKDKGLFLVTRLPDKNDEAKAIFNSFDRNNLTPLYENEEDSPLGMWCNPITMGEQEVKLLLICNDNLRDKKIATVNKKAEKELEKLESKIKKLSTQPAKCHADAQKLINGIIKECKLTKISNIQYEEVLKRATRGRPKKGVQEEFILESVKVTANIEIDKDLVATQIDKECLYIIATNDTEREWEMSELLSIYKRQSVIERCWRCCKDPRLFIDSLYLKTPSRIDALLWIMSIALLVYAATEYKVRKTMKEHKLTIPTPDHKKDMDRPTLMRLFQYIANHNIQVVHHDNQCYLSYLQQQLKDLLLALGQEWCLYFNSEYYRHFA